RKGSMCHEISALQKDQQFEFGLRNFTRNVNAHLLRVDDVLPALIITADSKVLAIHARRNRCRRYRYMRQRQSWHSSADKFTHESRRTDFYKPRHLCNESSLIHARMHGKQPA